MHIITLIEHAEKKPIISIVADICDKEQLDEIFVGVDVVFHCAAYINFQYPPDIDELERVNVVGRIIHKLFFFVKSKVWFYFGFF